MILDLFAELCDPWPDACFLVSPEGRLLTANAAGAQMLGKGLAELAGKDLADFVSDSPEMVHRYLENCVKNRLQNPGVLSFLDQEGDSGRYHCLGYRAFSQKDGNSLVFLRCFPPQAASNQFSTLSQQLEKQQGIQHQLQAERDLLESIAQNIGAGLRIISRDYTVLWTNSVTESIYGDTLGKTCYSTYAQNVDICPWCGVREIFATGKYSVTSEGVRYDQDGKLVYSEIVATAIYDHDGNITSALELVLPITERKLAERQLQDDEKRAEALLSVAQMPWATREELVERAVDEVVRLTGSKVGYFHFMDEDLQTIDFGAWSAAVSSQCDAISSSHSPLDKAGVWADCARLRQPVIHNDFPSQPGRKGLPAGHLPLLRHMSVPVFDEGRVVAIAGVGNKEARYDDLDVRQLSKFMASLWGIFKRKQMERQVLSAMEKWEMTFNAIDEIVTIHDTSMRIVQANKAAGRLLQCDPAELIGKYCFQLFGGFTEPCPGCPEVLACESLLPQVGTVYHTKLGKTFEVSSCPLIQKGELHGFVHIAKDVTQQKLLEAQLRQAQKMESIGTLAGGIAHDFNNILVPILGYAELALDRVEPSDPVVADLSQIAKAAYRAKELVKQILAFSRQAEHELWPIEPHLVIKEALKLLRSSLPTTIEIRQKIASDCGAIFCDPTQLHQIIMNLCTNAYHAMRDTGGVLEVSLCKLQISAEECVRLSLELMPGSYVRLEISDTGHGMDKQTIERIFEPYFTTKATGEGTGMGLSVVHGIVRNYHGYIRVDSHPGLGTTFQVYLPSAKDKAVDDGGDLDGPLARGAERILVVDDEKTITSMLQMILEKCGYQVSAVTQSPVALALFESDPAAFDLIITDMTMPVLTGFDLARRVLAIRPGMPIIICTGYSELVNKEKATEVGIRELLMKPVTTRGLANCVRKTLDGK
ncbi:MAG: GAF domain-containing protein [Desulfobulbaceae bacterium]|nr:GAF domain-containing protein [Desulfobulbaceae bacterium]